MLSMSSSTGSATVGGKEKRRNPRYGVDVRLRLLVKQGGKRLVLHGRGNDISENGMALFVAHDLEVGTRADAEFTLPYSQLPLRVGVSVRNRNGYRYGVEFMTLNEPQREEILRLCKALTLLQ